MRPRRVSGTIIAVLFVGALALVPAAGTTGRVAAAPAQQITPFLVPPFPGSASEESIFDHTSPNYSQSDNRIVAYGGHEARKNCPSPAPPGVPPPQPGVCDAGFGRYWSYDLADWIAYNGHDGIDYGVSFRPVYAAADADRVMYSGWWDPQNHSISLGIYVKLHHANGYITSYGHMSAVAQQACPTDGCASIAHGDMIGISGNTGNSSGPHLHFQLTAPNGKSVDPYGWGASGVDPWPYDQPESLWVMYPKLVINGGEALPSGSVALDYPPAAGTGILIDDSSSAFVQDPAQCWNDISVPPGQAQNNNLSYSKPRLTGPTCVGKWTFPKGATPGLYAVYIRIPAVHATTEGAIYSIVHGGASNHIVINQAVFPNGFYATDGWVYAGKYNFDGVSDEYVQLTNQTQDESAIVANLEVGADAVRFVRQGVPTPAPPPVTFTPTKTPLPSSTPTMTRTPTITATPPPSNTPTITRTPTASKTPTASLTFTPSRTPTVTRTPTKTPTASQTRLPTAIPPYTKINVYFVNTVNLQAHTPPYESAGYRWVKSSDNFPVDVLNEYFKGPGYTEKYVYRWASITSGFAGFTKLDVSSGVARLTLRGICAPTDYTYTVVQPLMVNLKQFNTIQSVKIYDQNGGTENPSGPGDSIPTCLDPAFAPSPTPTLVPTLSPTVVPTRTRTPTPGPRPTATPLYVLLKVYFYDRTTLLEVYGKRWASSSTDLARFVLDQYFRGPGYTEKYTYGWIAIYNGATGYSKLDVANGIARVYLTGQCDSKGSTFTIAGPLRDSLKQFSFIQFVKIYDQNGNTEQPEGNSDSIPACLEP